MIDVLGIGGSHRMESGTGVLVKRALSRCEEAGLSVKYVSLFDKKVGYCTVCDACKKGFECSLADDVFPILESMRDARALIVGSPTYYASVSGRLKALLDRTLPLRRNGMKLSGKVGGAVAVGASRNGGQEKVVAEIHDWMLLQEMIVVADKSTAHFGGIAHHPRGGSITDDETGLETVDNLADKIIETLGRLKD